MENKEISSACIIASVAVAAILWFVMFSPWTAGLLPFWTEMTVSALILTFLLIIFTKDRKEFFTMSQPLLQIAAGIGIALALWGVFWVGDKLSSLIFGFARGQVDSVYSMKEGFSPTLIALLLLCVIGPAEELFWRGFVQRSLVDKTGPAAAFFLTTAIYALVHIWSFNFMLVMAALVAGAVWGLIYWLKPSLLPALVLSHALWDALVFVILPI